MAFFGFHLKDTDLVATRLLDDTENNTRTRDERRTNLCSARCVRNEEGGYLDGIADRAFLTIDLDRVADTLYKILLRAKLNNSNHKTE